ncbi:MAG: GNAT family N-acetyltransferase [Rhizobiaceae bacterium]
MVDVSTSLRANAEIGGEVARYRVTAGSVEVAVFDRPATALAAYGAIARNARFTPPQSPAWIEAWAQANTTDIVVATLAVAGTPALTIALEVVRRGPFRRARFMGGHHANGNFAPLVADAPRLRRSDIDALVAGIKQARPDIDVLALERIVGEHDGVTNPLLSLTKMPSPNISLAVDLTGGFDELLKRSSGKRKRKKHRSQIRKFELVGAWRCFEATTPADIDRMLDAFFEMKRARLEKMGVEDVFAPPGVRSFFRNLFKQALGSARPEFVLAALEVGGVLRAVTGSSRTADRIICEFGAISEDELFYASPGDFLFFEEIRKACDDGLAFYDFSVGDEQYKRLWCDVEATHFDVIVPLTLKGRMLATAMRGANRLKGIVKGNKFIWALTKRLRRRNAAATPQPDSDD